MYLKSITVDLYQPDQIKIAVKGVLEYPCLYACVRENPFPKPKKQTQNKRLDLKREHT